MERLVVNTREKKLILLTSTKIMKKIFLSLSFLFGTLLIVSFCINKTKDKKISIKFSDTPKVWYSEELTPLNSLSETDQAAGIEKAIQFQTEQLVLTYLLAASIDEQLSFPAKARVGMVLTELKSWLEASVKSSNDPLYKAHLGLAIDRFKSPEKAKPTIHAVAPPGAPIGCEEEQF